jgi:hypothetical protein
MVKQGLKFMLVAFWAAVFGYGCSRGPKANLKPDWDEPQLAIEAVEKYLAEALKVQDSGITRYDNATRQVFYLKPVEVLKTEVRPTGELVGEVGVRMRSTANVDVLVDMSVAWDTSKFDKDSVKGVFTVAGMSFRQIGDSVRYRWEKKDDVYRKVEAVVQ